jgi:hypothetical protein
VNSDKSIDSIAIEKRDPHIDDVRRKIFGGLFFSFSFFFLLEEKGEISFFLFMDIPKIHYFGVSGRGEFLKLILEEGIAKKK